MKERIIYEEKFGVFTTALAGTIEQQKSKVKTFLLIKQSNVGTYSNEYTQWLQNYLLAFNR